MGVVRSFVVSEYLGSERFILLVPNQKVPLKEMSGWANNREVVTLAADDPRLRTHVEMGGNYALVTHDNLVVIACDAVEVEQAVHENLPVTHAVRSPRHKTLHFYYHCCLSNPIHCIPSVQGDPVADIKHGNAYVLAAGSTFENYGLYKTIYDLPIAHTTEQDILRALRPFMKIPTHTTGSTGGQGERINFPITNILPPGLVRVGDEYRGAHPVHGSSTGHNFAVNVKTDSWYCFRCNVGGGSLSLLAMLHGIASCDELQGGLKGDKFLQTKAKAENLGYIKKQPSTNNSQLKNTPKQEENNPLNPADRLIKHIKQETTTFFTDQYGTPYIQTKTTPQHKNKPNTPIHYTIIPVNSREFKTWASYLIYQQENKSVPNETITTATNVINGICQHEGQKQPLYNRVAPGQNCLWIDTCNEYWQAIQITPNGWTINPYPPILFRRYKHQKPLSTPTQPNNLDEAQQTIKKIFNHLNITPENHLIFLTTIISYLIPNIPHPILVTYGPQGSAKTTIYRFIRRLIDPSHIELLTLPYGKDNELIQQLNHHWLTFYDNLTYLTQSCSDIFCRAVTGAGFSKRELYTNDDDIIYSIKRCIGFNGINQVAEKGDLLDRSILVELAPLTVRKTEAEIDQAFEEDRADILGSMLTILSKALQVYSTIKIENYQRLADFHHWGCAIATALGYTSEEFTQAYTNKVETQTDETINNDNIGLTFLNYFRSYFQNATQYGSTPTELLHTLTKTAETMQIPIHQKHVWPQDAKNFSKRLNGLIPALSKKGYVIESRKSNGVRRIYVYVSLQTQLDVYDLTRLDNAFEVRGERVERGGGFVNYIPKTKLGLEGDMGGVDSGVVGKSCVSSVPVDPVVPNGLLVLPVGGEGVLMRYEQNVCYFCGGVLMGNDWLRGELSFGNPAHMVCYREEEEKKKCGGDFGTGQVGV